MCWITGSAVCYVACAGQRTSSRRTVALRVKSYQESEHEDSDSENEEPFGSRRAGAKRSEEEEDESKVQQNTVKTSFNQSDNDNQAGDALIEATDDYVESDTSYDEVARMLFDSCKVNALAFGLILPLIPINLPNYNGFSARVV